MSAPDTAALFAMLEATWPAAATRRLGPWRLRDGAGGGKRVSAATLEGDFTAEAIGPAEVTMEAAGQTPLFMIRRCDPPALDAALAGRGYALVDPTLIYLAPVGDVAAHRPGFMKVFTGPEPLAIMRELWAAGGIGPARLDVMARVGGPKCYLFAREKDRPAGAAFVALHGNVAMLHALDVSHEFRRTGVARNILGKAAEWAQNHDAQWFSTVTTGENLPAQGLFAGLGLHSVDNYHYRMKHSR
ncbi:GNAT family N-acetyltransferase [Maritimibacter sp. 55A14]|uniref:GNAT family N-acetyltransferase n=1 Tax=Maritimibacter sp. 55A14 TaxID=2174844 RepID=UPI000D620099|nr:GNAT family N-acetyltransferase [Maritimibacter sp. 55A14]PWE33540.1 GNAT family N-acetyltransferase [Maritimibacter sp. 55A14]